ncbi:hypothetical protein DW095_06635 [Bacteroides sp. AM07-16]|nr:hypothetical protein DW095_06635 [Bacteroides sp. AM07-16]
MLCKYIKRDFYKKNVFISFNRGILIIFLYKDKTHTFLPQKRRFLYQIIILGSIIRHKVKTIPKIMQSFPVINKTKKPTSKYLLAFTVARPGIEPGTS